MMRKLILVWAIAFVATFFLARGTPYWAFATLTLLSLSPAFTLWIAGVPPKVAASITAAILLGLLVSAYVFGLRESTTDPLYLPFVVAITAAYAYSWWKVRRA